MKRDRENSVSPVVELERCDSRNPRQPVTIMSTDDGVSIFRAIAVIQFILSSHASTYPLVALLIEYHFDILLTIHYTCLLSYLT